MRFQSLNRDISFAELESILACPLCRGSLKLTAWGAKCRHCGERYPYTRHLLLFQLLDTFVAVKYQDLAKDRAQKLQSLCAELGIGYFQGKENFWENDTRHFLFGSATVKNSEHMVYYAEQYDEPELRYLEENLSLDRQILDDILTILDAYEVDSKREIPIQVRQLKQRIQQGYSFLDRVESRARNTSSYRLNRTLPRYVYFIKRAVSKGKRVMQAAP